MGPRTIGFSLLPLSLCGCMSIGYGPYNFNDKNLGSARTMALEFQSDPKYDRKAEFYGGFRVANLEHPYDNLELSGLDLGVRYFPIDNERILPYVGGGVGYYKLQHSELNTTIYGCSGPLYPGATYELCYKKTEEDLDTLVQGFYPFVSMGIRFYYGVAFLFGEARYDHKRVDGIDLGGVQVMFGLGFDSRHIK